MNHKKSIILLITLFFISAISILILKNLDDTEKFMDNISSQHSLSQIQITMDNIKIQIPIYLKKHTEDIDEILKNTQYIPLEFANINILLNINKYEIPNFNINNLTNNIISNEEFKNNINFQYDFLQIVNKHLKDGNYTTNHQIEQTIQEYIKLTKDKDILNIKNEFTYFNMDTNISLIQCNYLLKVDDKNYDISFIFDLNSSDIKEFNILNIF